VRSITEDPVIRLRTGFLHHAVLRVREMVAAGEIHEAIAAGQELRRYFGWVGETVSPEERDLLLNQIQALPGNLRAR
jgi:hypothetical protein